MVGRTHELKGQALAAFVTLREGFKASPELRDELRSFVAEKIGAIAKPDDILFSADLPPCCREHRKSENPKTYVGKPLYRCGLNSKGFSGQWQTETIAPLRPCAMIAAHGT